MRKKLPIIVTIVAVTLVLVGVVSCVKANNAKKYWGKKAEVLAEVEQGKMVSKVLYDAYEEIIDVATETEVPVKDSFFEVKEETIDIHVLTTYGIYKVIPIEKPSKEELIQKVKKEAVGYLLKEFL